MSGKWVAQECPKCGARLIVAPGATHCRCNYCDNEFHRDPNVVVDHPGKVDWNGDPDGKVEEKKTAKIPVVVKVILIIALAPMAFFFLMLTIAVIAALIIGDDSVSRTSDVDIVYDYTDYSDGSDKFVSLESVDPFDNISWYYFGISGDAQIHVVSTNPYQYGVGEVTPSKKSGLSNGDTITLTAVCNKDTATRYGYKMSTTIKEITVEGLDEYVSDLSTIDSSYVDNMKTYALEKLNNPDNLYYSEFDSSFSNTDWEYCGYISLIKKNMYTSRIYLVYKSDITYQDVTTTVYTPVSFNDVIVDKDGEVRANWDCKVNQSGHDVHVGGRNSWRSVYGFESMQKLKDTLVQNSKADYYVNYSLE